jgi:hypothetical protein
MDARPHRADSTGQQGPAGHARRALFIPRHGLLTAPRNLQAVAMGVAITVNLWDIPLLLDLMGHLDDEEANEIYAATLRHPDQLTRRHVLRVYFKFCNRSKRLN